MVGDKDVRPKRRPRGYWENFENVRKELFPICVELGRMPTHKELVALGLESISRYGVTNHGGTIEVGKQLGFSSFEQSVGKHPADYWSLENTIAEILAFMSNNNILHFPTKNDLLGVGRYDIIGAIAKHKRLTIAADPRCKDAFLIKKPKKLKWTEGSIKSKLSGMIGELGHFPSGKNLDANGLAGMRGAISRFGGSEKFWKGLGQPRYQSRTQRARKLLNSAVEVKALFLRITEQIGHPPTYVDLARIGEIWLGHAAKKHFGSMSQLCLELGLSVEKSGYLVTNDGHLARSTYEAILDNILFALGVPHETEGKIPGQEKSRYLFDFAVKNLSGDTVYIELWGYTDVKVGLKKLTSAYAKKKLIKQKLYHSSSS